MLLAKYQKIYFWTFQIFNNNINNSAISCEAWQRFFQIKGAYSLPTVLIGWEGSNRPFMRVLKTILIGVKKHFFEYVFFSKMLLHKHYKKVKRSLTFCQLHFFDYH